ncbi:MAG: branched-chain amino acid transaminase [Archangium sp.]
MSATANSVVKAEKVWMDGKLVSWNEANVHVMTHALHYGLGVFEGIRAYRAENGKLAIFKLREHIRRFLDSAHIIMLKIPYTEDQLMEACVQVLASQDKLFPNGAYLRPVAFMGDGAMGLGAQNETRVAITAWEWGTYLGDKGVKEGIRAKVSSFTRMHVNVNMVRGKISGQYVNSILAKREAVMGGYDEAILLDISGFVAEASGENIFCVGRHGVVRTPSLSSPILRGITRDTVIRLLRDAGHPVEEVSFTRDALYIAGEVFFTGTAAEITPVREIDNRQVHEGKPGAITQMVQQTYARVVRGGEPAYLHWLTFV